MHIQSAGLRSNTLLIAKKIQYPERLSAFNTMAQPNSHPGLMSHLANAMIPAVATMASGVANPGQPIETATGSTVITKATIAPLQSLAWEQLLTLVKAAHNPRFCGPLSVAQSILANGATGDFCAFMAGLPTVVRQALPHAPDPVLKSYTKVGMTIQGNATIDQAVTDYLNAAFPPNPQAKEWYPPYSPAAKQAWLELMKELETVAPTATDRQALCSSVVFAPNYWVVPADQMVLRTLVYWTRRFI